MDKPLLKFRDDTVIGLLISIIKGRPILDTEHMKNAIKGMIGEFTFKEIHDLNKWNLNITVTDS